MLSDTPGIHHVTAIAGDPQQNVDFYTGVLGLRFLKRTVNHEDRFAYHLYYGDGTGSTGSVLTFFPYPGQDDGRVGKPQPSAVALVVPEGSLGYWLDRLADHGVERTERFGERAVRVRDPDGTPLELPPWFEEDRRMIESQLPSLSVSDRAG
jgi:glyoxalase family protein